MNKVKYGFVALIGAIVFAACGDDVTKVYEENTGISSVTSLKNAKCTDENDGAIVFSEEDKGMFACADGEWTSVVGKDSLQFHCETKALKDSSGMAVYCDGDSIGVVKNGKAGADDEENALCVVDTVTADSVWISCGGDVTAIALSGEGNLPGVGAKTYTRAITVVGYYELAKWKVSVFPLNDKLESNNQGFSFLPRMDVVKTEMLSNTSEAAFSFYAETLAVVTDKSYALIRVEALDSPFYVTIYEAIVDLRDETPLTISFLNDIKVGRVRKLVADGVSFEKAMEQADKELYKVYDLSYKGPIETMTFDRDVLELFDLNFYLDEFISASSIELLLDYKSKLKSTFAEYGNLNTPFLLTMDEEVKALAVDAIVRFMNDFMSSWVTSSQRLTINAMLEEEYALPSCKEIKEDTVLSRLSKGTMVSEEYVFVCFSNSTNWSLIYPGDISQLIKKDEILSHYGECTAANEWEEHDFAFLTRCEKDASEKFAWRTDVTDVEKDVGFCNQSREGKSASRSEMDGERYYACRDYQWTKIQVDAILDGNVCDAKTRQDSIYVSYGSFYVCRGIESSEPGHEGEIDYTWQELKIKDDAEHAAIFGDIAFGQCTEGLDGKVNSYEVDHPVWIYFECNKSQWRYAVLPVGVCDEDKVGGIYSAVGGDGKTYERKCYKGVDDSGTSFYRWELVSDIDKEVGFPCTKVPNSKYNDSPFHNYGGKTYYCNAITGEWKEFSAYNFTYQLVKCQQVWNPSEQSAFKAGDEVESKAGNYKCLAAAFGPLK